MGPNIFMSNTIQSHLFYTGQIELLEKQSEGHIT